MSMEEGVARSDIPILEVLKRKAAADFPVNVLRNSVDG